MENVTYLAIDPQRLDTMRQQGTDEFGHPWERRTAQGWKPLRCCLRKAVDGEAIALISYSLWTLPWDSPWPEAGPVFVCFHGCRGYPEADRYPPALLRQHALVNPFDHQGARAYQHIRFVQPDQDHEAAVYAVLSHPTLPSSTCAVPLLNASRSRSAQLHESGAPGQGRTFAYIRSRSR